MREELSIIDKKIVDEICFRKTHISKLFINHIPDLILDIDRQNQKLILIIKPTQFSSIIDTATRQTELIIYIINFLKYLEDNGYIMVGNFAHGRTIQGKMVSEEKFNKYQQNPNNYTNWEFTDKEIEKHIFDYCDLTIFPSYTLRIFKKYGYKTRSDRRHNQTVWISGIAIFISILLGFWSIYQTKIDDHPTREQLDSLIHSVQKIRISLNQFNSQQTDTLFTKHYGK